jgi:hypothetical protein
MAIQVQGNSGTVAEVETNTRAARIVQRPLDVGVYGSYTGGVVSGTMAAGLSAASPIFSFRWAQPSYFAVIRGLRMSAFVGSTGFAAGVGNLQGFVARSFTASDTGGTPWTLTGNNMKNKTAFATTGVADIRASATATLTAGTRTLDTQPFCAIGFGVPTTANVQLFISDYIVSPLGGNTWPIVLANNEGVVIQATVPATGVWGFSMYIQWDEVASF